MKLLTKELEARFPPLHAINGKNPSRIKIIAKFSDPSSQWTWYLAAYDPGKRIFYGLVRGVVAELSYFSLDDLEAVKGCLGLGLEQDLHFGKHTLAEVLEEPI